MTSGGNVSPFFNFAIAGDDHRMPRHALVELLKDGQRLLRRAIARDPAAPGFHHARRGRVDLVGSFQALSGFRFWPAASRIMPACRSLKIAYQSGPCSLSMAAIAFLASLAPNSPQAVSSVAVRSVIGPRTDLREIAARARIMLALERVHAEHQARDTIVVVCFENALGKFHRLVDIAADQQRQECAVEQLAVLRIALERGPVIGGGGERIAFRPAWRAAR